MREDILNNLEQEMNDNMITPTSTCKKIYRGVYLFESCLIKPCCCYSVTKDLILNLMKGGMVRKLNLFFYIYANNLESLHDACYELENFLFFNYSKTADLFMGDLEIIEGIPLRDNINIRQSLATLECGHKYDYNNF